MVTLQKLQDDWADHPLGKNRAKGGRIALSGFLYQLYLSLDQFFTRVLDGEPNAQFAFEGLSDVAEIQGEIVYLSQVKVSLDRSSLRSAVSEALAVWRFLTDTRPELLEKIRFRLAVRRIRSSVPTDVGYLEASDLGLDGEDAELWRRVRERFLPTQVSASPKVELAIKLWPHSAQCFTLVDRCLGRLFSLLGANKSSDQITEELLQIWDQSRAVEHPPCHLLGPGDFYASADCPKRIVQGPLPRPNDLRDGCFMERPELLNKIIQSIRDTEIESKPSNAERRTLQIFWINGPSGCGKSVLLLQAMRELVLQGDVETANYLGEIAHSLPRALDYWAGASQQALIVVDDIFAPGNRDPKLWSDVAERAFSVSWERSPWILTCGPSEQLRAFKQETHKHPELRTVEIRIDPLRAEEREAYHAWYEQRTGVRVSISNEQIFVAAAWTYELRRKAHLSPEAFANRLLGRLQDLGLKDSALSAMSLNQYGLQAPDRLFLGLETQLDALASEQIYRLARTDTSERRGRFFHPRITSIIYETIVPASDIRRRAEDFARGFGAMLDQPDQTADQLLEWLGKVGTANKLSKPLQREILVVMWPYLRARGPREDLMSPLKRWHELAISCGVDPAAVGAVKQIKQWFDQIPEREPPWGFLFQIVWEYATDTPSREHLYQRGVGWLEENQEAGSWNWIWQQLWAYRPKSAQLIDAGFIWLYDNPAHPGWGRVWQCIFDSGLRTPDLLVTALEALPSQPESSADLPIWQKIEALGPEKEKFLGTITRKLARVKSVYKMD